jgi:hypothetical protein
MATKGTAMISRKIRNVMTKAAGRTAAGVGTPSPRG